MTRNATLPSKPDASPVATPPLVASLDAAPTRTERDSFGPIEVPTTALWGAQTARSLRFFAIGEQRMPLALIHALAHIKWAAARVNRDLGLLDAEIGRAHV